MAWRYILMNLDTTDQEKANSFQFFATEIEPKISPIANRLNTKLNQSKAKHFLGDDYKVFLRSVATAIELFREENVPLFSELQVKAQEYGAISSKMTIEHGGKELTLQRASLLLKENDRSLREAIYKKISARRAQDSQQLQSLFDKLRSLRHKVALNTGFQNYRDYKFKAMNRFDYTTQDCEDFHASISEVVTPFLAEFAKDRQQKMGLERLKPWDLSVDPEGLAPLKPFDTAEELVEKSIEVAQKIDKDFGDCLTMMRDSGHLDLASKQGKAPGGFNYPLFESGLPFIYMNAVGANRDLVTMMHEGGHALHSYLTKDLPISDLKSFPSEVAELASMSMELISMDHWDVFYTNKNDLKRAKKEQLKGVISGLPWIALVDKFQHYLYENQSSSVEERNAYWESQLPLFSSNAVDFSGFENNRKESWLRQLHIFEVPFYYIEYGFAQLGAVAVWKNYKENPSQALKDYKSALSLGGTRSIPEIYKAAGIRFKFDKPYVKSLMDFVAKELKALEG